MSTILPFAEEIKVFSEFVLKMTEIARNRQREIHQTDCGKIRNRDSHSVNSRRMREISVVTIISPAHGHMETVSSKMGYLYREIK